MAFASSSVTCLITLPGEPTTRELSGISLFSAIKDFAPIMQLFPILALFKITAPIPIKLLSPIVHPWSITRCPTVTFFPIFSGYPGSVCKTLPSCMFEPSPT